jgi:hypothetical protein
MSAGLPSEIPGRILTEFCLRGGSYCELIHFILLVHVGMTLAFHELRIEQWILARKLVHNVNYMTDLICMYNFYFK